MLYFRSLTIRNGIKLYCFGFEQFPFDVVQQMNLEFMICRVRESSCDPRCTQYTHKFLGESVTSMAKRRCGNAVCSGKIDTVMAVQVLPCCD